MMSWKTLLAAVTVGVTLMAAPLADAAPKHHLVHRTAVKAHVAKPAGAKLTAKSALAKGALARKHSSAAKVAVVRKSTSRKVGIKPGAKIAKRTGGKGWVHHPQLRV